MFHKSLDIPSKLDSINIVERAIDEISEINSISSDIYGKVLIAVIEAVNNAITHGNKLDSKKIVKVNFSIDNNVLLITVKDQGVGFNPFVIPDPTAPENIENISGRGVFIMQRYSDKLEFEDNGTMVKMNFNL